MFRLAVQQVAVQQASSFTPAYRKAAPLLVRAGWLGGGAAAVTASAALCELTQAGKARAARLRGETEELEEEEEAPAVATAVATSVVQENDEDGAGDDGGGAAAAAKGPAAGSKADKNYLEDPSDLPDPDDEATIEEALNCPCISGMKEGPCGDAFCACWWRCWWLWWWWCWWWCSCS